MRGDSRRDLYAKALALCGLGVLAGVGAVVDYWPVAIRFPAAGSVMGDRVPEPLPVPDDAWARVDDVTLVEVSGVVREDAGATRRQQPSVGPAMSTTLASASLALGREAALFELAAPLPALVAPLPLVGVEHATPRSADMVARLEAPALVADSESAERLAADARDSGRGMFGTAVQATGRSLARSGAATGASLADAFRAVGGFFRRALPD